MGESEVSHLALPLEERIESMGRELREEIRAAVASALPPLAAAPSSYSAQSTYGTVPLEGGGFAQPAPRVQQLDRFSQVPPPQPQHGRAESGNNSRGYPRVIGRGDVDD